MYGKEFWERVSWQQMRAFFQHGTENTTIERGDFERRYQYYAKAFTEELHRYRNLVLSTDWNALTDETARRIKGEDLYAQAFAFQGELEDLSFEVGMAVGFRLCLQLSESWGCG